MTKRDRGLTGNVNRRAVLGGTVALAGVATAGGITLSSAAQAARAIEPVKIVPEPQQVPATEGFVDVGGARLWYWDTGGAGEAIVLSHPGTGSGAVWTYQQPVFAKAGYRVIGYSRRGHFKSELTDPTVSASGAEDLHKLIVHLGLKRFHLVGSAGGTTFAAQYAVNYPQTLLSVVLGSNIINIQDKEYQDLTARVVPRNFDTMPPEFREVGASYRVANAAGTERWIALEKASRIGAGQSPMAGGANGGTPVTFENLGALKVPMLLLTGDCDLYVSPAMLIYIAKRLGKNDVTIIENAGHAVFWEQPEAYNRTVLNFIKRNRA